MGKVKINDMYLQSLKSIDEWVTVSEWAFKVCEMFPDLYAKAEEEAKNQKQNTNGKREIAARISSRLSRGAFAGFVEVDETEKPRRVRYSLSNPDEVDDDLTGISREEIKERDEKLWSEQDKYCYSELDKIKKTLGQYLGVPFELDHATALLNKESPGNHHPRNLQILIKGHNVKKSNSNWKRFTIEEQVKYLKCMVDAYKIIADVNDEPIEDKIIDSLIERLKIVYK